MSFDTTACVIYAHDGLRHAAPSTLGVWIAKGAVDPLCSAVDALRQKLEGNGFDAFDIWCGGNGFSVRVTTSVESLNGIRARAVILAQLVRKHFGVRSSISQLPSVAAVDRALA